MGKVLTVEVAGKLQFNPLIIVMRPGDFFARAHIIGGDYIMLHYVIAIIMVVAGIILAGYELFVAIMWLVAKSIEAVVVDVETRLGGILIYHYEVYIDGLPQRLTQKIRPLNPLKYVFPKLDIGKSVNIKYNPRRDCLFQHPSFGIVYFAAGLVLLAVGLIMLTAFWLVP